MKWKLLSRNTARLKISNNFQIRVSCSSFCKRAYSSSSRSDPKFSYFTGPSNKPLVGHTVGRLTQRAAELFGDTEGLVSLEQNIRKTFTQINEESDRLAAGFVAIGLKRGDRLGIWGPNSYEWYLTQFAAGKAGLILVNINPSYRTEELRYCLKKVSVKGIVCAEKFKSSDYYSMVCEITPEILNSKPGDVKSSELPNLTTVITMQKTPLEGAFTFQDLFNAGGSSSMEEVANRIKTVQFDEPYNIQFTSGTTGLPKGALLSHHNMVNNAYFLGNRAGYGEKQARICVPVPLYHCFGCVAGSLVASVYGCSVILPSSGFDPKAVVKCFSTERINSCYGTPTMFVDILNEFRKNPCDVSSMYTGIMAGAPCPKELVTAVINELNMKWFFNMYGMTETSPVSFQCFPKDEVNLRASTVGCPLDHTEVKVVDENNQIVPIGQSGELLVRGYCNFMGYWDDEEKTSEVVGRDRWLKTGDIVTLDEKGYATIIGRIKDMVIRGGENIYPAELENFYMSHPQIIEAQVIGVPDERMGEELAMWVRIDENSNLTDQQIKDWSKGKIAHYKIPRYILIKSEFPSTVTGKIQKFKMKEITIKELEI